ncbi:MAG: conjugal transfer protein TraO [Tannerella sp.]|nr:conjugal transfer protein TraO [Tannerella sp.]
MKKIIITVLLFLLLSPVMGQLRHVKGIGNFGVTYGINKSGSLFGAGYSHYFQPNWIWNVNALYESGKVESTQFNNLIINGGVDYTCFRVGDFLYFNIGLSVFTGFEKLTSDESTKEVKNFSFGPAGNANVELYLNSRFLFQIKAEQYYSPLSDLGKWFPVYSLSLKYCIF